MGETLAMLIQVIYESIYESVYESISHGPDRRITGAAYLCRK
ncbi:predicted protein [Botrytis cinerea T4]|uniref:Uncharacterized protein n=1 Tax=Botryotinia fuckeliana (strain T4) TaxID=999810 RepID=G2YXR9_BOTF4|nr:predicted protein [Botrytis cinerea T4]